MSMKLFLTLSLVGLWLVACAPMAATLEPSPIPESLPATEPQFPGETLPFQGFPEEYQAIKIPPELLEMVNAGKAEVLQLPPEKTIQKEELYRLVQDDGYLEPYNFDRLAEYADEKRFTAVPERSSPQYADWVDKGVKVGLVYDTASFYAKSEKPVFEVYLYDKKAELRDQFGMTVAVLEAGKDFFWTESSFTPEVLTFFIKNGCWLCWNAGGRCGCLICF
jgi:hypothetical protein